MFFIPIFPRTSFPDHALGQSSLTLFLQSLALGVLVSSYTIDSSCRNYKSIGNDISGDIARAVAEAELLASNAFTAGNSGAEHANNLLFSLFGPDQQNHATVINYFEPPFIQGFNQDFVLICGDGFFQFENDVYEMPPHPIGVWVDHRHSLIVEYEQFVPCNPARKIGFNHRPPYSYIVNKRFIYLCPLVLDMTRGRSIAPYKDQDLTGEFIDEFMILPVILLNNLLYMYSNNRRAVVAALLRDFPPEEAFSNPNINVYDPQYLRSLPLVGALGFSLCRKLAKESPNQAVHNCNSVALFALGAYLSRNDWGSYPVEGFALPPSSLAP